MIYSIFTLMGGLGLFLFGINLMSERTERAFGNKIKSFLGRTATNKFTCILIGTLITALVQSSSAITVMTVSLIESSLMTLYQAAGIIMGANIGTTVTSLLIAFDFSDIAPAFIFTGAAIKLFSKREKLMYSGEVLFGFGVLFLGLDMMSGAFSGVKDNPAFINLILSASGKTGGILCGILMTVILQSSSATVGILQSLANENLVAVSDAVYIVLGQNIGTVITVILASIGRSKQSKQVAAIHLLFNLIGSAFFVLLGEFIPVADILSRCGSPSMQISLFHIVFNIVNMVILIPFYSSLIRLSEKMTGNS